MSARRTGRAALLLAAGLALAFPSVAVATPTATPTPTPLPTASATPTPTPTPTTPSAQHRISVVQPDAPFAAALLKGTKPAGEKATVTTPWGDRYEVPADTTQVAVSVACPPAGWKHGVPLTITYTPEGGAPIHREVEVRDEAWYPATMVQPEGRFDNAWVVVPSIEVGGGEFTIRTEYGFNQAYPYGAYGVFPPPAGGWVPGRSYRVDVHYASGRSSTLEAKLSADAADSGLRGTLSGPDREGMMTVELTGVPLGERVLVTVYKANMRDEVGVSAGRAATTSPRHQFSSAKLEDGETYVVLATVGTKQPLGDDRWVHSFTYRSKMWIPTPVKPAPTPGKPDPKPGKPAPPKEHSGGLAKTGR